MFRSISGSPDEAMTEKFQSGLPQPPSDGVPEENRSSWDVYSIRERNLMFINAVMNILGMNTGKTWDDVRRGLSDDQVKQIHEAFESLWPKDTNIVELLPRLDERVFRTLYLGVVDPRTITVNVTVDAS